jgi:hypothetical protein
MGESSAFQVVDLGAPAALRQKRQSRELLSIYFRQLVGQQALLCRWALQGLGLEFKRRHGDATHLRGLGEGGEFHADGDAAYMKADGSAGTEGNASQAWCYGEGLLFVCFVAHD